MNKLDEAYQQLAEAAQQLNETLSSDIHTLGDIINLCIGKDIRESTDLCTAMYIERGYRILGALRDLMRSIQPDADEHWEDKTFKALHTIDMFYCMQQQTMADIENANESKHTQSDGDDTV